MTADLSNLKYETEWANHLGASLFWLPESLRSQVGQQDDPAFWTDTHEITGFLRILTLIAEERYDDSLNAVIQHFDESDFRGELFLLRARIHLLLDQFDKIPACFEGAVAYGASDDLIDSTYHEISKELDSRNQSSEDQLTPANEFQEFKEHFDLLPSELKAEALKNPSERILNEELNAFLRILGCLMNGELEVALNLVRSHFDNTGYPGHLFLIRSRIHVLQDDFDSARIALAGAQEFGVSEQFIEAQGHNLIEDDETVMVNKGSYSALGINDDAPNDSKKTYHRASVSDEVLVSSVEAKDRAVGHVWSSYLTMYPDPQAEYKMPNQQCRANDPSYVYPVASSCHFHALPLTLFVDQENEELERVFYGKNILMRYVERTVRSSNDERFFIYLNAIGELADDELVLLADCSDVYFKRNPFEYLSRAPGLVVGEDVESTPCISQNRYLMDKYQELANKGLLSKSDAKIVSNGFLVNAGVIGGRVRDVKPLLEITCRYLNKWSSQNKNLNMPALNLAVNQMTGPVWVGKPFTSGFKKFEVDSAYYVVHK